MREPKASAQDATTPGAQGAGGENVYRKNFAEAKVLPSTSRGRLEQ